MAEPTEFEVDVEGLGGVKDRLEDTFLTFIGMVGSSSADRSFGVTGSADLTSRLDEFFDELSKGTTKFTAEILDMMKRLRAAVDNYERAESDIKAAADESTSALRGT